MSETVYVLALILPFPPPPFAHVNIKLLPKGVLCIHFLALKTTAKVPAQSWQLVKKYENP